MDPFTQGLLGASAASARRNPSHGALRVALLGFLAGMAADLDVLIRSSADPLLFLEYHRQFSHSLIFIPVGGLICGLLLHTLFAVRWNISRRQCIAYCTAGYATHALLDACTTYGTQLLWPFSDVRIAWNTLSIIDPLYTLPIAVFLLLGLRRRALLWLAIGWIVLYPCIGWRQRERASDAASLLAHSRGHYPETLEAKPSFGNLLVWKTIYRYKGVFYVDAVRSGRERIIYEGASIPVLQLERDLPWLDVDSTQANDIARFAWFSQDYIALDPKRENTIIDVRYSLLPNEIDALWSIQLDPERSDQNVVFQSHRDGGREKMAALWAMLRGVPELSPR